VLLETTQGPIAIACTGSDALRLQQALSPPGPWSPCPRPRC